MNYQFQLRNIKQQLGNIDIQLDNLNQIQNIISPNVGIQIYNMAIQILNTGIRMLNIGSQLPNMGNDNFNYGLQFENIGMQIQNIGNQIKNIKSMNNLMMPNSMVGMGGKNAGMGMMSMNNDEERLKGFQMGVEEIKGKNEIKISFHTTQGVKTNIFAKKETTIDGIIKQYLCQVNKPELIGQGEKLCFLFNAYNLKLGDKRKIEDFFKGISDPKIVVNDVNYLIKG